MKILVTGSDGYIGTRLAAILLASGHDVTGLDTGFYREGTLYTDGFAMPVSPKSLIKDLRRVVADDLAGFDAIVHLAELSNDPLGQNRPEITFQINHQGSVRLATLARQAGVSRFVYASSCSVYGAGTGEFLDETSPVNPQTAYAHCKVMVENDLQPMASNDFCVVFLRNATAFGPSPRMRFDIVLNDLCALAYTRKVIAMVSDGSPWRPIVHIEDICQAVECALVAPASAINGEAFNVGHNEENYRIREIAAIVASAFPGCDVTSGPSSGDNRSYRVSFDKIASRLPGFRCRWTAAQGARELAALFDRIEFDEGLYGWRAYTRLKQLKHLLRTRQIDDDLFWQSRQPRPASP